MMRRKLLAMAAAGVTLPLDAVPQSRMGLATTSFSVSKPRDTYDFLELAHSLGGNGIQAPLSSSDPHYLDRLKKRARQLGMYIELMAPLPKVPDVAGFERTAAAAREIGALCIRCAALPGRRYETFQSLPEWQRFVTESLRSIDAALAVAEKHRVPLALENHKDWTLEEFAGILRSRKSPYFGVCLDTGNNLALLDDPMELIDGLAPHAVSTHIKDMAVEEYADGFLLSEVPLGEGMLDLKSVAQTIRTARPQTRFTLEMITRDPLQIPCLTENFWATMPDRSGKYLARTLQIVRSQKFRRALPRVSGLPHAAQLRLEVDNVKQCLHYAREQLGL